MTPTERRALYSPAVVEAWEWLDTYCRHWAVPGRDWQTLDNLSRPMRRMPYGLIHLTAYSYDLHVHCPGKIRLRFDPGVGGRQWIACRQIGQMQHIPPHVRVLRIVIRDSCVDGNVNHDAMSAT